MIAELGHFALLLAFAASLAQAIFLLEGARRGDALLANAGRHAAIVHPLLATASFAALVLAFVADDRTVLSVASRSHPSLAGPYRAAAAWGGLDGAMLLWATMLSLWTLAFRLGSRRIAPQVADRALGILGLVSSGFLGLLVATASPFARLLPASVAGRDVNPLLQDPLMALHPPLLVAGSSGLAVAFALSLAGLPGARLDAAWARGARAWALAAWCALTMGLATGALWAYREPGWGGGWTWSTAQNAALMPWIAATALLHALAVVQRRGIFRRWAVLLAILALATTVLGMALARPGSLAPVHDAAADGRGGASVLAFLAILVCASLAQFAKHARTFEGRRPFELISREAALAANNATLLCALGVVMLGTLYPLAAEALGGERAAVGPPYFTMALLPLVLTGLLVLGPGSRMHWGSESARQALHDTYRPAAVASLAAGLASRDATGADAWAAVGVFLSTWIAWHVVEALLCRWRRESGKDPWRVLTAPDASFYAMHIAHLGVALLVAGIALSGAREQAAEFVLAPGSTESLGTLRLRSEGVVEAEGRNHRALRVRFVVTEEGREIVLEPEMRWHRGRAQPTSVASTHAGLTRDLHASLTEPGPGGAWGVRLRVVPFMSGIWAGAFLLVLGGLLAVADRHARATPAVPGVAQDARLSLAPRASP